MALAHRLDDGKSIMMGLGAHLDARVAISRAVAEMIQMLALDTHTPGLDPEARKQAKGDEAVVLDWLANHSLETDPYCRPDGVSDVGRYGRPMVRDLKEAVDACVRAVSDRGHDMIVLDHSRPEIDFAAARVVVPGLRHFWARFREGRLYSAPVQLGWLDSAKPESELNPIPFFL